MRVCRKCTSVVQLENTTEVRAKAIEADDDAPDAVRRKTTAFAPVRRSWLFVEHARETACLPSCALGYQHKRDNNNNNTTTTTNNNNSGPPAASPCAVHC